MNGQSDFRALLLKIQELLSDNDRHRLHFIVGEDVPRHLRDDLSVNGTLRLFDSLFEKAFISDQDCDYLIQTFKKIHSHDAVKRLQEYQKTQKQSNQGSSSLHNILFEDNEEDKICATRINCDTLDPVPLPTDIRIQSNSSISVPSMQNKTEKNIHKFRQMNIIFKMPLNIRESILLILLIIITILALLASPLVIKPWNKHIQCNMTTIPGPIIPRCHINNNTKWKQNGLTIARGNDLNLSHPYGIYVDNDHQCIYITDSYNHRIVEWKYNANISEIFAGGHSNGNNRMDQLNYPTDVIVDKKTDFVIICDRGNDRVVRWPRQNGKNREIIIYNISCYGLTMDNNEDLYVSDYKKNEVRRWKIGESTSGTIVAGGNGNGNNLNQLNYPTYIFVDKDYSIYVSDNANNRVMKWIKGEKEGIVVAGGQGQGNRLTQLSYPEGVIVDDLGNVYVSDSSNHRIMYWPKGSQEGRIIVGGNGKGQESNQLDHPSGLSLDQQGNLYVVDSGNNRVQKFEIYCN